MTLDVIAAGDIAWDFVALGRLGELGRAAESVAWHSPDWRQRPLFERSRAGLRFVGASPPGCGEPDKSLPIMGTPPPKPLGCCLVPDPERVAEFRAALPAGPLGGLVWGRADGRRNLPLAELAPLASLGCTFVCPQLGAKPEELEQLRAFGLSVERPHDHDPASSLDDTAALIECCEFVVTSICSEAYVAAALGKPTYVISYAPNKARALSWFANVTVLEPAEPTAPSKWTPLVADLCSRLAA